MRVSRIYGAIPLQTSGSGTVGDRFGPFAKQEGKLKSCVIYYSLQREAGLSPVLHSVRRGRTVLTVRSRVNYCQYCK